MITVKLDRNDVEYMLKSVHPSIGVCSILTQEGYMHFTGNQHNESWQWDFTKLRETFPSTKELFDFYQRVKINQSEFQD